MSPHHRAPIALLLRPDLANAVQLEWAVFLAAAGRRDLLILQREEDSEDRFPHGPGADYSGNYGIGNSA